MGSTDVVGWFGAAAWVAMEMIIARFLGGFPWTPIGASQAGLVPLIQIASITGVYGVAFLVVGSSLSALSAVAAILVRPHVRSAWLGEIILPIAAVVGVMAFGTHQLVHAPSIVREVRMTLIQPSIPQTMIWDPEASDARFTQLIALTETALTNQTDLVIWPEAAIPKLLRWNKETFDAVSGLAHRHHVWMIVGSDDAEPRKGSSDPEAANYFNSSFLINPDGELVAGYHKRSLVIFGEYIPLQRWMPFIKVLVPWMPGSFMPGDKPVPFEMPNLNLKTSVLICFEDVFPHLAREYVKDDTDFLIQHHQ